jgi:pyocin large subunit-like protein
VKFSTSCFVIGAFLSLALPCLAQQESSPTPPASAPKSDASASAPTAAQTAAQTPAPSADQSAPSADMLKRAKSVGMHPETHGGKTQYCWEDASLGSRFATKKCTDEAGLDAVIAQREATKQTLRQSMSGTSAH